jgi:hypothetical protein
LHGPVPECCLSGVLGTSGSAPRSPP